MELSDKDSGFVLVPRAIRSALILRNMKAEWHSGKPVDELDRATSIVRRIYSCGPSGIDTYLSSIDAEVAGLELALGALLKLSRGHEDLVPVRRWN